MENKENIQDRAKQILQQYLLHSGMRQTPERYAILHAVYEQAGPFSIDTLYTLMEPYFRVSRVTLYNALNLFISLGLVVRHPSPTADVYEKCYGQRDIFRQICTHCGEVSEFRSQTVSNSLSTTPFKRFRAEHICVYAYGVCSKCQARITRQLKKLKNSKDK